MSLVAHFEGWRVTVSPKSVEDLYSSNSVQQKEVFLSSPTFLFYSSPQGIAEYHIREGNLLTQSVVVVELLNHVQLFCQPMDCSPPGSSVHGSLQARILEWVAISFSRGPFWPRDWKRIPSTCFLHCRQILYHWTTKEAQCTNSNAEPFQKQSYGHTKDND